MNPDRDSKKDITKEQERKFLEDIEKLLREAAGYDPQKDPNDPRNKGKFKKPTKRK